MEKIEIIKDILTKNNFKIEQHVSSEIEFNEMVYLVDKTILYFEDNKLSITFDIRTLPEVSSTNYLALVSILENEIEKIVVTESYYRKKGSIYYGSEAQDKLFEDLKNFYVVEYLREKQNDIYLKDEYYGYNC